MIDIRCGLGVVGDTIPIAPSFLNQIAHAAKFAIESGSGTPPDIDLGFFSAQSSTNANPIATAVRAFDLHLTSELIAPATTGPVQVISGLFADRYEPRESLFGLMFDRGYTTWDDPNAGFTDVPRQGCVVFAGAIARAYGCDDASRDSNGDFRREVRKTLIHELGHVFNLGHIDSTPNYMHPYPGAGNNYDRFTQGHQEILQRCSSSNFVQPGGSFWGELGPEIDPTWGGDYDAANLIGSERNVTNHGTLSLSLNFESSTVAYCQPLELDVALSFRGKKGSFARVPDVIDPGYEEFSIWIRRPNGETFRYRPFNRYCGAKGKIDIRTNKSFRRDISIFLSASGYTFRDVGIHEVWAELAISSARKLTSDPVSVEVVEPGRIFQQPESETRLLKQAAAGLFYRTNSIDKRPASLVQQLNLNSKDPLNQTMSQYALCNIQLRMKQPASASTNLEDTLKSLTQSKILGGHRRGKCAEMLEQL